MKVNLVVASGSHQGKTIPITGPQFLIGRDGQCHLRPASQAISKRHCGVMIRDGKVFIRDFGSTNGTTVNDQLVKNAEIEIDTGALIKLGPLDFVVQIERTAVHPDGTPLPSTIPGSASAIAAVRAAAKDDPASPQRDNTPDPAKKTAPAKDAPTRIDKPAPAAHEGDHDEQMAAMLLGMDENGNGDVPDGSTVMEIPTPEQLQQGENSDTKDDDAKSKVVSREEMTSAASEILRKMMRRPK